ncbi:MAG: biotin--[acetyl-CoA-carboxylase] ligase [Coprobacillus sp.]
MENKILKILNQNKNEYVSGQMMSSELNVSRMSISSYMKKLKEKGYHIKTSTKKGYCLTEDNDVIFIDEIKKNIHPFYQNIEYYDEITSTNDYMKTNQYNEGDIIITESQSKGKGRNGKSFYSPKQKGIYLSFLLKPSLTVYDSLKITACCAVAVVKAIQKNYPLDPQIKWVNDIILNNKKVCGILCEATLEMNTAQLDSMIVGVGINVHTYEKPDNIIDIATSLEDEIDLFVERQKIIIDFLNEFYDDYSKLSSLSFLDDYRKYSYVLHQHITVYENNNSYPAFVTHINDDASLTVRYGDEERILRSGEISIRRRN